MNVNGEDCAVGSGTFVWSGTPAESVKLVSSGTWFKFTAITITYSTGGSQEDFIPKPVVTPDNGTTAYNRLDVSMALGENSPEGTKIYYAYSDKGAGSAPDYATNPEEYKEYTAPFQLTRTIDSDNVWEVKAVAVSGDKTSAVETCQYTIKEAQECSAIKYFMTNAPAGGNNQVFQITAECTVVYQTTYYLFVTDGESGLCIYSYAIPANKYKVGDVITNFCGYYTTAVGPTAMYVDYSLLDTFGEPVRTGTYEWPNGTYADLSNTDNLWSPYEVKAIYFSKQKVVEAAEAAQDNNVGNVDKLVFANGGNVATYKNYGLGANLPAEDGWYDVQGVTFVENDEAKFIPFSFVASEAEKTAAPVFSPEAGTLNAAFELSVSSETPDAYVRYTLDGTEPTMESPVMTDKVIIDKQTTVKAFAVAQGFLPSEVETAEYQITTGIEGIDAEAGEAEYFDLMGRRVSNPANGLYIKRTNGTATKVMAK